LIPFTPGPFDPLRRLEYEQVAEEARKGRFRDIRARCITLILIPLILLVIALATSLLSDIF
jgi:hypothetical protein